jgi:hypothetical protein
LGGDTEQLRDEILEVGGDGDDQLGVRFALEIGRMHPGLLELGGQHGIRSFQML